MTRIIPSVKGEKEGRKAMDRLESSVHLMKSLLSGGTLADLDDDEDRSAVKYALNQIEEDERVELIQNSLHEVLNSLEISELSVEQWNPWDWTVALDSMVLKLASGKIANLEFFLDLFEKADSDGSGDIDSDELFEVLQQAGMNVTKEGIEAMITHVDEDGDGEISRDEWSESVSHYLEKKKTSYRIDLRTLRDNSKSPLVVRNGRSDSDCGSGDTSPPIK